MCPVSLLVDFLLSFGGLGPGLWGGRVSWISGLQSPLRLYMWLRAIQNKKMDLTRVNEGPQEGKPPRQPVRRSTPQWGRTDTNTHKVSTCPRAGRDRRQAQEASSVAAWPTPWCAQTWCRSACRRPPRGFPEGGPGDRRQGCVWRPAPPWAPWHCGRPPPGPHDTTWTAPCH